jgi:hypothetical protein
MDNNNQDLAKQYQDILDHYSRELSDQKEPAPPVAVSEPKPLLLPPITPPSTPTYSISTPPTPSVSSRPNNLFKHLFFISLLVFLGVFGTIAYTVFFSNKSQDLTSNQPTSVPESVINPTDVPSSAVCEVNDKQYQKGESFPAVDNCNTCTCGADLTITCTQKSCEVTPSVKLTPTKPSAIPTINKNLIPADAQSPAAGICSNVSSGTLVSVIIGEDNVPQPRCTEVATNQKLIFVNNSAKSITIVQITPKVIVKPGNSYQFTKTFGTFLAPGVHRIGGAEIWLQN